MEMRGNCCESRQTSMHKIRHSSRPIVRLTTTFFVSIQGLVKVVLSRIKIFLNLPLQRETFNPLLENGDFARTGLLKSLHYRETDFDVALHLHTSASQESFKRIVLGLKPFA